ncbi:carboxypeptidase-like regulatory domain-containing protein, partial [Halorientalis sp.]|uniref:carboxypeptidase-like regulatory domain-containing protein n=1 Tax=Halorientalis sp. TaxID=1931229 RepID=UPI0026129A7C
LAADTYTHGISTTNDTETAQITLNPETVQNGTVAGTVTNASGDALPGTTVLAGGETTTTAADGSYSLSLEPGSYQVTANADGFQSVSKSATVTESNTTTVDFSLTAENDDGGDGIVDLDGPTEFTGYVLGDESYLHTGTEDNDRPLTYSRCRDGQPDPAEQDPGFLPTNDCITVRGTAYPSNNSWVGDLNITPVTGIINDTQEENFENIYFNADFSTVDGAQGTFDTQTGETSLETTVAIDVSIWPVGPTIFGFNSPAQNPYSSRTNLLTEDTCEIPNTQIVASTEKSYTTASPFPSTDTVSGERLNRSLSGKVVTDDFSVESATSCGSYFGVNLTEQVNIEQGIPAPSGENELAYDIELNLQNGS